MCYGAAPDSEALGGPLSTSLANIPFHDPDR